MRIRDLRDWHSCLQSIRQLLVYSRFKAAAGKTEEKMAEHLERVLDETDQAIAEGMLRTVISLLQEEVSAQIEQFAAELANLQRDAAAAEQSLAAEAYVKFFDEIEMIQKGLPAVVETFKAYAEGRYDMRKESLNVLREAQKKLHAEPQVALRLVGEAGALHLRGLEEVEGFWLEPGMKRLEEPMDDWMEAEASVVDQIADNLVEFPLSEVELVRDQWRAPNDKKRIEYKKGKLFRLGIVDTEIQALLLPLFAPQDQSLNEKETKAIIAAGPKVLPGLIAIAGDEDSALQASISGGEAAVRAVQLLGDLRAAEAVPTLLEILKNSDWDAIIHDQALVALQDKMPDLAFDTALEVFDRTTDFELKSEMAGVLAKGGKGKPGVFERLIKLFHKRKDERGLIGYYLGKLGDVRALPDLHEALRRADDWLSVMELAGAIEELGGEVTKEEDQKYRRLRAELLEEADSGGPPGPAPVISPVPVRVTKIGRNEPCPCGSGKKYKKCCGR